MGTVENQQGQDIDDNWVKDRRKEFEELIDSNHDGIVTMEELEVSNGAYECWCVPGVALGLEGVGNPIVRSQKKGGSPTV